MKKVLDFLFKGRILIADKGFAWMMLLLIITSLVYKFTAISEPHLIYLIIGSVAFGLLGFLWSFLRDGKK